METKNDEFQALRLRLDQVSSELDKQDAVRAVNTKWMIIVGAVILAALGFTSFVQLPREAAKAARDQVGPEIIRKARMIAAELEKIEEKAQSFESKIERMEGRNAWTKVFTNGEVVVPPDGTEKADWVAFISPSTMGTDEDGSNKDNALLIFESTLVETESGWVVRAIYRYRYNNADSGNWHQGKANVLLIPSMSSPSSNQANSADARSRAAD